jgi:archaemetzincin
MSQTIKIHPFNPIDPVLLADLEKEIETHFRISTLLGEDMPTPMNAYSKERGQFQSRGFLLKLSELEDSEPTIHLGVTEVDLFAAGLNFVFGEASRHTQCAVFSLARLDPRAYGEPADSALLLRRAIKEAIHELGHVFGLQHCDRKSCVMWFSNTLAETDLKGTDFCPRCARLFYGQAAKAA